MSSGKLEFALGLAAGNFVSGLGKANAALKGFMGATIGMGAIATGVWAQIDKGAKLADLSKQTGDSVGDLFRLQKGLKEAGLEADGAGAMIYRLNNALGGISETGEPTGKVFSQMRLSIDALKKMNGPEALQAIAAKLGQLDRQSATAAAGKIFGRGSAAQFLQLARSSKEFGEGLRGAATQAAMMQRYAPSFDELSKSLEKLKGKTQSVFLGIAGGLAPGLENVVRSLNKIDLSSVGEGIGTYLTALTQAFSEGKLGNLVAESLKFGFTSAVAYAPGIFSKLGTILLKVFETPLIFFQAMADNIIANMKVKFADKQSAWDTMTNPDRSLLEHNARGGDKWAAERLARLNKREGSVSFGQSLKEAKAAGLRFNLGAGEMGLDDLNAESDKMLESARANVSAAFGSFKGLVGAFAGRAPVLREGATFGNGQLEAVKGLKDLKGAEATGSKLEKMGFVFGGTSSGDHARATAQNTARTANLLEKLIDRPDPFFDRSPMNQRV